MGQWRLSKWEIHLPTAGAGASVFSCPWTRTYTIGLPGSQTFGLGLGRTISSLLAADVRTYHHIVIHNCMSQFLLIKLYLPLFLSHIGSVSVENPNLGYGKMEGFRRTRRSLQGQRLM